MSNDEVEKTEQTGKRTRGTVATIIVNLIAIPLGPLGQAAAAAAGPYIPNLAEKIFAEWRRDGTVRVEEFFDYAYDEIGDDDPEKFANRANATEETRLFTAKAAAAAFNTTWNPKVQALGRLLAKGLIDVSGGVVPIRIYALPAMAEMEQLDVALLNVLVRYQPTHLLGVDPVERYEDPRGSEAGEWHAGRRMWTIREIGLFRPQLAPLLPGLLGTLQRHGLAVPNDISSETVQSYFREFVNKSNARQNSSRPQASMVIKEPASPRKISQTWSPTEFGEQVLSFYQEAALEIDA